MKPVDMLGLGPKREATQNDAGWVVKVTPPEWSGFDASSVQLTEDQYIRYLDWNIRGGLIHVCLSDLSAADREILMTGIGDKEFERFKEEEQAEFTTLPPLRDQGSQ